MVIANNGVLVGIPTDIAICMPLRLRVLPGAEKKDGANLLYVWSNHPEISFSGSADAGV